MSTPEQPSRRRKILGIVITAAAALLVLGAVGDALRDGRTATATPETTASPTDTATTPTPEPSIDLSDLMPPEPTSFEKLSSREWQKIVKDPDAHAGEGIYVYGEVTQFDAATGNEGFRASAGGEKKLPEYGYVDYETNAVFTSDADTLSDVVQGDLFTAKVMVVGSYSYETQIGGETTVPQFEVVKIKVTGSV